MIQKTLLAVSILLSGFAVAYAAKPDFAFPEQVSKTASKELKSAMKADDGPATMRALINLTLAQGLMEPDSIARLERTVAGVTDKAKNPVTKAMSLLLRAEITDSVQWADSALVYTDALRAASVKSWTDVVKTDNVYMPTLYDFAVSRRLDIEPSDSLLAQIREFHSCQILPLMYWTLYSADEAEAWALYDRFDSMWQSYYPLVWLQRRGNNDSQRMYDTAMLWLKEHPEASHEAIAQVKRIVAVLTAPQVHLSCRPTTKFGETLPVKVQSGNVNECVIAVFETQPLQRLVKKYELHFTGSGMFANDTVVNVTLPRFGSYHIVPLLADSKVTVRADGCDVTVTDFWIEAERYSQDDEFLAIDPVTGEWQSDVTFSRNKNRISGVRGDDKYSPTVWCGNYASEKEKWTQTANLLTDRAIYHPGDTVRFVATVYEFLGRNRRLCAGMKQSVKLLDANGNKVADVDGITDDMGRVHGILPVPDNVMTGYFRVVSGSYGGSASVMVSDYKAPEFEVTAKAARIDSVTINVSGSALNYSGFPVQNASVNVTVDKLNPWVWCWDFRSGISETLVTVNAKTDLSGRFSVDVTVPAKTSLSTRATVTSALGESHDADCFVPGKPYYIKVNLPENMLAPKEAGWNPSVDVVNADGDKVELPLSFTLVSSGDTISPVKDWSAVPSGRYSLTVATDCPELADTVTVSNLVIYRDDDRMPPFETALWTPSASVNAGQMVRYGTSYADSHIRYVLWTPDSIIEKKWLSPGAGMHSLKIELPAGVNDANITMWTIRNYETVTRSMMVKRQDVARNLKLEVSSLRDKVSAGDCELWTVKVVDNLGKAVSNAAVVLDVYSKALDALQPFTMAFNPQGGAMNHYWLSPGSWSWQSAYVGKYVSGPELPYMNSRFDTYGQNWPYSHVYNLNGHTMIRGSHLRMYKMQAAVMDMADVEEVAIEESAPTFAEADAGSAAAGASVAAADGQYRLSEVPLALWKPVLTTDVDGCLQVQFVAPNANTTWAVKALAYDSALLTGTFGADIIASKPVMVQTSWPRFLRQGDVVTLRASAVNNTDSIASVAAGIELYDPMTGKVIDRVDYPSEGMAPMSSKSLSLPLTVGNDWTCLGIRASAAAGSFSDGEQTVIPVLPSEVTVLESTPVLLDADSAVTVIDTKPGSVLQLTSNAAWECVTALPGLMEYNSTSLLSALGSLFSAVTADGLLRAYPEIGKAIRQWEKSDTVLVSRLMKNEDLKIALLENTPWVGAAESDSERMARLSLLLNKGEIKSQIDRSITTIAKLTRGGGLCWVEGDEKPSEWMTLCALSTFAQLKKMGYLPSDKRLDKIIVDAVKYIDNVVARDYAADSKNVDMTYAYVRTAFKDVVPQPSTARKVSNAAVQHAVAHWRDYSLRGRAQAAVFLNGNGYHTTARRIVESLRQYSAWKQVGVTAWVLEAFAEVEPSAAEIDMIRMWLLSQKQTQNWGRGYYATDVIYSILSSGTNWLVPSANALSVKVNGKDVDIAAEDSYVGEFRIALPEGGKVSVTKGRFPAWGGIWSRYESEADSVSASAGKELRINRSIDGELSVGSRVVVTITIDADRPMDYVMVVSPHCAGLQPVNQLPHHEGWWRAVYTEPTSQFTNFFIHRLPKGRSILKEEYFVTDDGTFILAPAQVQSQYAPEFTATSGGCEITLTENDN